MEFLFTQHDGGITSICDRHDGHIVLERSDGVLECGEGFHIICHKYDIDKLIETLKKVKDAIEIICEFEFNKSKYRIMNDKGIYKMYYLEDNGIDSWVPYSIRIYEELFDVTIKALVEKK
jgi:hypothetical protein